MKFLLLPLLVFLLPATLYGYCFDGTQRPPPSNLFVVQSWDGQIENNAPAGLPRPAADIVKDKEHHASEWVELGDPKELKLKPVSMFQNVNRLGVRFELIFGLSGPVASPWTFRGVAITNNNCKVRLETSTGTIVQSETITLDGSGTSVTALSIGTFPIDPDSELYEEKQAFIRLYNGNGNLLASHEVTWECKCDECGASTGESKADIGSVEYNIPITSIRNGRTPVAFEYRTELLANQGRSKLVFNGPQGTATSGAVVVVRNGSGQIDSVTVGDLIAVVTAAPVAGDSQRFMVTVSTDKADPSTTVYRTVVFENATVGGNPAFKITETLFGKITESVYQKPSSTLAATTWEMTTGNGLRLVTETTDTSVADRETKRRKIQERKDVNQTFQAVSDLTTTRRKFSWGWETILEVTDPDGQALATSWDFYDGGANTAPPGGSSTLGNGSVKSMNRYDGQAELHYYYAPASLVTYQSVHETRSAFAGTGGSRNMVESEGLDTSTNVQVFLTETFIGATQIGKATFQRNITNGVTVSRDYSSATAYLESQTSENSQGGSRWQIFPDGTRSVFTENSSGTLLKHLNQKGAFSGSTQTSGDYNVETLNEEGYVVIINNAELASPTTGFQTHLAYATSVDQFGRPLVMSHFPSGSNYAYTTETEYACCGLVRERDKFGIDTYHAYDSLRRRVKTHRLGVTTETVHAGRTTSIHRYPETVTGTLFSFSLANPGNEISRTVSNLAGDVIETWNRTAADGSLVKTSISTAYAPEAGLSRRVTTQPPSTPDDGAVIPTRVEEFHLDGQTYQQTGNLAPAMRHAYAATATGVATATSYLDGAALRETTTTQADWLGREVSKTYSSDENADSVNDFSQRFYNPLGQLSRTVDPDGVVTLYGYNPLGQQTTVATDLNGNLAIDLAVDRVSFSQTAATRDNMHGSFITVARTTRSARIDDAGNPIELVTLREDSTYDGLRSWSARFPGRLGSPTTQFGAETVSITTLAGPGSWTVRTTSPDATYTIATHLGGRLNTLASYDRNNTLLHTLTYSYDDPLFRLKSINDSRSGTTTFHYVSDITDAIQSVTDSINRITSYTYDSRDRKLTTDLPDTAAADNSNLSNITTSHYFPDGTLQEATGAQTYRSTYIYDYAQRLSTLTTYGTQTATTRWEYDTARGLLRAKRHDSAAPGSGLGPIYTYTAAGRVKSRTWARLVSGQPLVTTYGYDPASGDLSSTTYSDATPPVTITTRDRLGRITAMTDSAGTHTYSHKLTGPMLTDAVTGAGPLAGFTLTQSPDTLDRPGGTDLTKFGSAVHSSLYGYDAAGRPGTLSHAGRSATYAYHPTRQRLAVTSLIGTNGQTNLIHEQVHDNAGRLLHTISHATPAGQSTLTPAHLSKYTLNDLNQRTAAAELGDRSWNYGYNATGEVTRGSKSITSTGEALAGRSFLYEYDSIGNRLSTQTGGDAMGENLRAASYTPNALNQYSAISHPGFLEIYGKAPADQVVTVNTLPTTRQGTDFRRELNFDNANTQRWEAVTTSGGSLHTSLHHIPAASTAPDYDLDGNLTSDGQWTYTWDAENRLTSATRTPAAISAGAPYRSITYGYDSQSRQISRSVATTFGGLITTALYLYNGWNCIAEYTGASLTRTYLWGLDLSGTPQGAGGVGGLLSISDIATATTHYPCYDGNGNVRKLLDATTSATTATYDYGPFGELTRATGPFAISNPYRFSTKPQDSDTGLYYYGYRYYDPLTGRWPSRDPIEERGGFNLYGFVGNDGVNRWDYLGKYIGAGYGTIPPPQYGDNRKLGETTGDASVPNIVSHIAGNILNSAGGFNYNNQAADYWTFISVLGLSASTIDGDLDRPAQSLFQKHPEIKDKIARGQSVKVDHLVTWFAYPRAQTIGHLNVKVAGSFTCQPSANASKKWKFKGNLKAEPDRFDFDQKVRTGVTGEVSIGILIPGVIMSHTAGWFYIKFMDELKNVEYEGYVR